MKLWALVPGCVVGLLAATSRFWSAWTHESGRWREASRSCWRLFVGYFCYVRLPLWMIDPFFGPFQKDSTGGVTLVMLSIAVAAGLAVGPRLFHGARGGSPEVWGEVEIRTKRSLLALLFLTATSPCWRSALAELWKMMR